MGQYNPLVELVRNEEGLWYYGYDTVIIPSEIRLPQVMEILRQEDYSVPQREGNNKYRFVPNDGKHNVVIANFQEGDGTLTFHYSAPDGRKEIEDGLTRIAEALAA